MVCHTLRRGGQVLDDGLLDEQFKAEHLARQADARADASPLLRIGLDAHRRAGQHRRPGLHVRRQPSVVVQSRKGFSRRQAGLDHALDMSGQRGHGAACAAICRCEAAMSWYMDTLFSYPWAMALQCKTMLALPRSPLGRL